MTNVLAQEFSAYFDQFSIESLEADLQCMRELTPLFDDSSQCRAAVYPIVRDAIAARRPFAMIRIGDGEGNILASARTDYLTLVAHSVKQILLIMYGDREFSTDEIAAIRRDLVEAIYEADILGVSDTIRLQRMRHRLATEKTGTDYRGLMGSAESIYAVKALLEGSERRPSMIVTNLVHRYLGSDYSRLFSGLDWLGYIAPYDLDQALRSSFNVRRVQGYRIPNQASSAPEDAGKWYPQQYADLVQRLDVPFVGAVFLVAAGILGKSLCMEIKRRGGIALDIGSMVDVWTGRGVRNYHDAAFIAAHRLGG